MEFLASLGLVWIIKDSYILSKPREYLKSKSKHLKEFLSCSLCLGFWVGLISAYLEYLSNSLFCVILIYYPFATAAFCWFFDGCLDLIQEAWLYFKSLREKA